MNIGTISILLAWGLLSSTALHAQDIDVERARQAYLADKAKADEAQVVMQRERSELTPYFQRLEQAKLQVERAENAVNHQRNRLAQVDANIATLQTEISNLRSNVQSLQSREDRLESDIRDKREDENRVLRQIDQLELEIERLKDRIRDLESHSSEAPWVCTFVDRGHEEHRNGHKGHGIARADAAAEAKSACEAVHGTCELSSCEKLEVPELAQLRRELRDEQERLITLRNNLRNIRTQITDLQQDVQQARRDIQQAQSRLSSAQDRLETARSNRQLIVFDVQQAQSELQLARSQQSEAQGALNAARGPYDRAVADFNAKSAKAKQSNDYLQQVIANYNAVKQQIVDRAKAAGQDHGVVEATKRGTSMGAAAGSEEGAADGAKKGTVDGMQLAAGKGYREGFQNPQVNAEAAASFQSGVVLGADWAKAKAKSEDFPKSFNESALAALASVPLKTETVDISESISTNEGGNGVDLTGVMLAPVQKPAPVFALPSDPIASAPQNKVPQISVPAPSHSESQPPCSNLPRPEFVKLCNDEYVSSYDATFQTKYRSEYAGSFGFAYNPASTSSYMAKFNAQYESSQVKGVLDGARDKGVVQGFADAIAAAQQAEKEAGVAHFASQRSQGHMLDVEAAEISEEIPDGVITPNEGLKLKLVIDNHGNEPSPLSRFEIKVLEVVGGKELNIDVRQLPALAANTRTELLGVVKLKNAGLKAGDKVTLKGALIRNGVEILAFESNGATHFPVEITDIKIDRTPRVNEAVGATVVIKNMSNKEQTDSQLKIHTVPKVVTVTNGLVKIDKLQAGQTIEHKIQITPGVWVSEAAPVKFLGDLLDAQSQLLISQAIEKIVAVKRNAMVDLKAVVGGTISQPIVVKAGSRLVIRASAKLLATSAMPGPFVLRYTRASHDSIKPANNSTVSINYGSLTPNSQPSSVDFTFDIPADLKGQKGWVMLQLDEGAAASHAPQIYLDIQ
jgi:predicted  nucleic acid-binding Zn-ribbon protein